MNTLEDYKSYYEDSTKEQILNDTYIDYVGYQNLAKEYSKVQKQNTELKEKINEVKTFNQEVIDRYPFPGVEFSIAPLELAKTNLKILEEENND